MSTVESRSFGQEPLPVPEKSETRLRISFGAFFPETVLTNDQIEKMGLLTSSGKPLTAEDIKRKVGVEQRLVAGDEHTPLSMGIEAARRALGGNGEYPIDFVFFSTNYPNGTSHSAETQKALGIESNPKNHLDIHFGCSGFVAGLNYLLKEREEEFQGKRVLFVSAEKTSLHLPLLQNDSKSLLRTIFSDGAVAMVFTYGKDIIVLQSESEYFPDKKDCIKGPISEEFSVKPYIYIPTSQADEVQMDGADVYRVMSRGAPELIKRITQKAKLTPADIKMLLLSQASMPIVEIITKLLPPEYNGKTIRDYKDGNFSSAAIPKMLMQVVHDGKIEKGDIVLTVGYGLGPIIISQILKFG